MKRTSSGDDGIAQRNFRFRSLIIILAGVLGFVLGALYLSVEQMEVTSFVVATGPAELSPGEPTALRVSGLRERGHGALSVQVASARWRDGAVEGDRAAERDLRIEVEGSRPAIVRFDVPEDADGAATVVLSLRVLGDESGERTREVAAPVQVTPNAAVSVAQPAVAAPAGEGGLRVTLLPEVRVLSWRFDGPLFARVTEEAGAPVAAAVTLRVGRDETRSETTGPFGLAAFPIVADRPRYQIHARAEAGERHGEVEEDLRPVPRGRHLRVLPRVVTPGGRVRLEVAALEREETLHCDLVADGRILDAFTLHVSRGAAAAERVAPGAPGRYAIQCAPYYRTPGPAFTSAALVVAPAGTPPAGGSDAVLVDAVEPQDDVDAGWLAAVRAGIATADPAARARVLDYLTARLTPDYVPSVHLASTLEGDRAALAAERDAVRARLLLALGVALTALLVWALVVVGANLRDVRRRSAAMAALLAEDDEGADDEGATGNERVSPKDTTGALGDDEDDEDGGVAGPVAPDAFVRTRSVVQYAVIAVLLIVNLVALLWLLGNVVR